MSEFELISASQSQGELWIGTASIFMSTLFAYVVTAYLIGAKLTRSQVGVITGLYSVFSILLLSIVYAQIRKLAEFDNALFELNPDWFTTFGGTSPEFAPIPMLFVLFCAFLAGLLFMIQVRRKG